MTAATIQDAMSAAGLRPAKDLHIPGTGKLIRYRVDGDKPGSVNGWAVLHEMGTASFGSFGSWKTGATHAWRSGFDRTRAPTAQEREEIKIRMELLEKARREELAKVRAQARDKAATLWKRAKPATNAHPYLVRKRVNAYGLRALGDALLIPLRDTSGTLHSLQFIYPDGGKKFLTGGMTQGCYVAIGRPREALLIAEGYATAATLHQASGLPVAACFSANNMEPVARALRAKFPELRLVLCADDDRQTQGNPGLTAARAAARAVRGVVAVPVFEEAAPCQS